jgi:hypothetical protein
MDSIGVSVVSESSKDDGQKGKRGKNWKINLVTNGTTVNAVKQKRTAEDCMCATSVGRVDTKEKM